LKLYDTPLCQVPCRLSQLFPSTVGCRQRTVNHQLQLLTIHYRLFPWCLAPLRSLCHIAPVSDLLIGPFIFLLGMIVGSFLNVCILRLPAATTDKPLGLWASCGRQLRAITFPASACPQCGARIRPYDNIPVLSYLALRGRCRACHAPISALYPAVEALTGLLFLACYLKFDLTLVGIKWSLFSATMIVLVFTDIRQRILPDLITFGGALLGLALSLLVPVGDGSALWLAKRAFAFPPRWPALSLADALFGAAFGAGVLWLVAEGYFRLRKREGMGLGDVKMMALVGSFLGLKLTFLTLFLGSLAGSILGLLFIALFRKDGNYELPFGVFLAAGALLSAFWGEEILAWYAAVMGVA
jgi:leader peptidase (prepilin peptidase)/N-methyltransferase